MKFIELIKKTSINTFYYQLAISKVEVAIEPDTIDKKKIEQLSAQVSYTLWLFLGLGVTGMAYII